MQLNMIGTFDGRIWRPLGEGLGTVGSVEALCVANTTGIGSPAPGLYAAGLFSEFSGGPQHNLKRWDGSQWHDIPGLRAVVMSLHLFDEDGPGPLEPSLFVGGGILEWPGGTNGILLRWDGTAFSLIGAGLGPSISQVYVKTMTIFDDDGPGPRPPALYVGGSFQTAGGLIVNHIARWDGTNWESLGAGTSGLVQALAVFDADGDGPELPMLYAGGQFLRAGGQSMRLLARWDGSQWSPVPGYDGGGVTALHVFDDDGNGPNKPSLFVSGLFHRVNGVYSPGAIKWDGSQWLAMGSGLGGVNWAHANAMGTFDEDGDPATPPGLYMGGSFLLAGGLWAPGLARWGCAYTACYADCEASTGLSTLDLIDYICFQHRFVTGDPYACDCDTSTGPNVCDMLDFLCFQRAFLSGCP